MAKKAKKAKGKKAKKKAVAKKYVKKAAKKAAKKTKKPAKKYAAKPAKKAAKKAAPYKAAKKAAPKRAAAKPAAAPDPDSSSDLNPQPLPPVAEESAVGRRSRRYEVRRNDCGPRGPARLLRPSKAAASAAAFLYRARLWRRIATADRVC